MSNQNLTIVAGVGVKPTHYAGCFFRSRLEARWAVFFDALGVPWRYEPERYVVGGAEEPRSYLPDFFLPRSGTWVEVKGNIKTFDRHLLGDAVDWNCGLPGTADSVGSLRGLLLLGDIPRPDRFVTPYHPILQHHKGGFVNRAWFEAGGFLCVSDDGCDTYFDASSDGLNDPAVWAHIRRQWSESPLRLEGPSEPEMFDALRAARSARFEGQR